MKPPYDDAPSGCANSPTVFNLPTPGPAPGSRTTSATRTRWQRRRALRPRARSLVHPFEQIFEMIEPALPEPGHLAGPVGQRGQGAELRAIVRLGTFVTVAHQPGLLQN